MDRLAQLKAAAGLSLSSVPMPGASPTNGADGQPSTETHRVTFADDGLPAGGGGVSEIDQDAADTLTAFMTDAGNIVKIIDEIEGMSEELKEKHSENMQTVDETRSRMLRSEIDQLSDALGAKARTAKEALDAMNKKAATLKETPESVAGNSALIRIQDNQYHFLVSKLTQCMGRFQKQQSINEASYKAQTQRQIKIKYTNPDGSAIDDATAVQLAEQVMENRLNSYIFQQSKDVLASIIETRNDIYKIEQSMRNLNQLFNDLAFLVNEQGELMDVILANVQASTRYVEAGRKELKKARQYQKKSRKKLICIIVCVVIVIVIVGVFVGMGVAGGTAKI